MIKVAELNELNNGERKSVFIEDIPSLLFRVEDSYYAIEDVCTHDGQPLGEGECVGTTIRCPRHGAKFDIQTGKALCMPAINPVQTFLVEQREDGIYAGL